MYHLLELEAGLCDYRYNVGVGFTLLPSNVIACPSPPLWSGQGDKRILLVDF